jgi:hypothetical protein
MAKRFNQRWARQKRAYARLVARPPRLNRFYAIFIGTKHPEIGYGQTGIAIERQNMRADDPSVPTYGTHWAFRPDGCHWLMEVNKKSLYFPAALVPSSLYFCDKARICTSWTELLASLKRFGEALHAQCL